MDHANQQKFTPKDIDITYQDPGSRHLLQNRQLHPEPVTQHHQMYRDYRVQLPSPSNTMVPQYTQTHRAETFQQQFNNREVYHEVGATPLPVTQDNVFSIRNKTCKSKSDLPAHEDEKAEKKPFICKFCQKGFLWKSALKQHLRIHTGEKPYVCEVCNRRFNQTGALNSHKLTHTGEKPCVCYICGKSFARNSYLQQHLEIHTGQKNYICEVCNKSFTTKQYLYQHRNHQHSENTVFKQKRQNKNTEVANKQEVLNTEFELEPKEVSVEQKCPLPQSMKSSIHEDRTVAEYCWTTAAGSKCFQEIASNTTKHLGSTSNTQSFVPIEQPSMHMVPQFLNLDAPGHPIIKTVAQQNIAHSVPHVLREIGHQTAARNGHASLAYSGQAIDTINHTLTPEVYQNIGAQSYNHLMTADQKDIDDLGYKSMDRLGIGVPLESIIEQSTTATHNCGTTTYHLPCALNDGCHFKKQKQTSTHAAFLTL